MGVYFQGGLCRGGVSLSRGISVMETTPPLCTDSARENITLPQTSFAGGNKLTQNPMGISMVTVHVQYKYLHTVLCKPFFIGLGLSVGQCEHIINVTGVLCTKAVFTLDVCVCVCVCINVTIKFNIVSMETQTQTHRMGLNPFLTFSIDTMLNLMVTLTQTQTSSVNTA